MSKTLKLVKVHEDEHGIEWQSTQKVRFLLDEIFQHSKVWQAADFVACDVIDSILDSVEKATGVLVDGHVGDADFHAYAIFRPYIITGTGKEQGIDLQSVSEIVIPLPPDVEIVEEDDQA